MSKQIKMLAAFLTVLVLAASAVNVIGQAFSDDVTYYTFSGNAYEIVRTGSTYNSANNTCSRKGGHVLYINSAAEQNFITGIVSSGKYWIGAIYSSNSGWTWGGGSSVLYSNWYGETPSSSTEKYAYIDASTGYWHNSERSNSCFIIVEYEGGASKVNSANETNNENAAPVTGDDPQLTTMSKTDETETETETVSETETYPPGETAGRQSVSIVYVRETAASGFTLPPALPEETGSDEEQTTNIISTLDIGDTVYIYEDTFYYQIANASEIVIAYYIGAEKDVTIPQTIDGMPVKYITHRAFQNTKLSSANIPSSVIAIDKSAFCNTEKEFTIYGAKNSEAERCAEENGFIFRETSFFGTENEPGSGGSGGSDPTQTTESNKRLAVIVVLLTAVVVAAATIAFFIVRREKILSAVEAEEDAENEEKAETSTTSDGYAIEYDDGSDNTGSDE
ncbi:MAG: hypothetical protein IJK60_08185 [Clostridia bacterium]|nr:hypothetical protein [Clostridia bacterium]